jgi:hypothetical protein
MIDAIPLLLAPEGYQISRSVRLRSSASAYFNRTPASAGNRKTWTWSGWVKRGTLGAAQVLMSSDVGTSNTTWLEFGFDAADTFTITSYTTDLNTTSAVFRDPSSWYHVVVQFDSTQATAANRCRIYINGVQQTLTGAGFTLNADYGINNNQIHDIGRRNWASGVGRYFDGYLTEINFIDGQALTPSSFGQTNYITGVWSPIKYTGTYGTNGFYLNFSDNSGATATTIGKDYSGNGNNWTPNNISVTAGTTYDSMLDVPTQWADGGNGRGNYAVLNPLLTGAGRSTLSNANLTATSSVGGSWPEGAFSSIAVSSGKWYCEFTPTSGTALAGALVGVASGSASRWYYSFNGNKYNGTTNDGAYGASYTDNDVIGVALDLDAGTLTFFKNGVSQGQAYSGLTGEWLFGVGDASGGATQLVAQANFGQRPFAYTPPTGFLALNTLNLPTPTILKGNQYMDATLYTGTGASQSITNTGSMQPDLVWVKGRSGATDHALYDSVRGVQKQIESNTTTAETTETTGLTAFNSNGFTVGALAQMNTNTATYVGWQWKEGATQGFDIVTYTGNSTANRTVAHSLGVTPSMIIVKNRSAVQNWPVAHTSLAANNLLILDTTNATTSAGTRLLLGNSSTFTVGDAADYGVTNQTSQNYVAYLFAAVAGFSRFGSYTGNGSTDGPFVFCGFRPRWVMIKRTDAAGYNWRIWDGVRNLNNVADLELYPNSSSQELSGSGSGVDLNSNGFKLRSTDAGANASGGTYIYAAFAEVPYKNSLAR